MNLGSLPDAVNFMTARNNGLLINKAEIFGRPLPTSYPDLLAYSNGGEFKFPKVIFSFWKFEDLNKLNSDYNIRKYLGADFFAIGSDSGSICFILDYRSSGEPKLATINFGDLDINEVNVIAVTFEGGIKLMASGEIADDNF